MHDSLANKTALITGGALRLGREIALSLASARMNLVIHYNTSADPAHMLCDELNAAGVRAWPVQADLENPNTCEPLIAEALDLAGGLHLLVNNAAVFPTGTLQSMQPQDLIHSTLINAWAPFALSRAFHQQAGRGHIINLLDTRIAGFDFSHSAYILSKHLLALLTRMTAVEFAPNVAVNAVAPGLILPPPGRDDAYLQELAQSIPFQHPGRPEDIASAVLFLAQSTFITGQILFVDGGQHLQEKPHGPNPH